MTRFLTRRRLAQSALSVAVCAPVARLMLGAATLAAVPALDPNDPAAKALGYVVDSIKPGSTCGNCVQFQGHAGDVMGPCTIFPGKPVHASGWCLGWAKKPA